MDISECYINITFYEISSLSSFIIFLLPLSASSLSNMYSDNCMRIVSVWYVLKWLFWQRTQLYDKIKKIYWLIDFTIFSCLPIFVCVKFVFIRFAKICMGFSVLITCMIAMLFLSTECYIRVEVIFALQWKRWENSLMYKLIQLCTVN